MNSLDPDQDQQNIGPDLDPNCDTLIVLLKKVKVFISKRKVSRRQKKDEKLPGMQRIKTLMRTDHVKRLLPTNEPTPLGKCKDSVNELYHMNHGGPYSIDRPVHPHSAAKWTAERRQP